MPVYYVKTSTVGRNKITAFGTGGPAVNITTFAVGDSNGVYYEPTGEEAALVHQVWSGNVNRVYPHPNHPNWIVVEAIIPASQGGFDIREALVKDDTGAVIAIGKYPLTNKPAPGSGSEKDIYARMIFNVTDAAAVNQTIDPSLIMATQEYVDARMPHRVRLVSVADVALAGLQIIDTVQLADNDRVLLTAQNTAPENGIYTVHAGAWQRSLDADNDLEMLASMLVIVSEGAARGDTIWMLTTNAPIIVGTTALTFIKIYPDEASRTISDAAAPAGDTATPTTLFGWLANMVKSITGKANWRTAPATTLETANTHHGRTDNPHQVGYAQTGAAASGHNHVGTYEPANANIQTHVAASAPHAGHALINSPTLTGNPASPTSAQFDNSTSIATTAFVQRALGNFQDMPAISVNTTFTAADMGKAFQVGNVAVTLPAAGSVPVGSSVRLFVTGDASLAVVGGASFVVGGGSGNIVTSWQFAQGDECTVIRAEGYWYVFGSASLKQNHQFGASLLSTGYQKLPSGLIIQWGVTGSIAAGASGPVTFPIAFPADLFSASAVPGVTNNTTSASAAGLQFETLAQMTVRNLGATNNYTFQWIAIGY